MNINLYKDLYDKISLMLEKYDYNKQEDLYKAKVELRDFFNQEIPEARKSVDNAIAVLSAFYNCTSSNPEFNIIYDVAKQTFNVILIDSRLFKDSFDKLITDTDVVSSIEKMGDDKLKNAFNEKFIALLNEPENMRKYFDTVINNEILLNKIFELPNEMTIRNFYDYAKQTNDIFMENNDNKYQEIMKKIEEKYEKKGFIKVAEKTPVVDSDSSKFNTVETNIEKVEKRDELFTKAAEQIEMNPTTLIKKVGEEKSLEVDSIKVDEKILSALHSRKFQICSVPMSKYEKLVENIKKKKIFKYLDLDIKKIDGINTLMISSNIAEHDKIATTSKEVIASIQNGITSKMNFLKSLIGYGKDNLVNIKKALINTSMIANKMSVPANNEIKNEGEVEKVDISSNNNSPLNVEVKSVFDENKENTIENENAKEEEKVSNNTIEEKKDVNEKAKELDRKILDTEREVVEVSDEVKEKKIDDSIDDLFNKSYNSNKNKNIEPELTKEQAASFTAFASTSDEEFEKYLTEGFNSFKKK